jgi:hypothetical protein
MLLCSRISQISNFVYIPFIIYQGLALRLVSSRITPDSAAPKPERFGMNVSAQRVTQKRAGFGVNLEALVIRFRRFD